MSSIAQTLFPPQSIFSEVQAIHDTGVYFREPEDTVAYNTAVSCEHGRLHAVSRTLSGAHVHVHAEFGWGCL